MRKLSLIVLLIFLLDSQAYGNEFLNAKASEIVVIKYDSISTNGLTPKFSNNNKSLFYYDQLKRKGIVLDATTYKQKIIFNLPFIKAMAWHPNDRKIIYLTAKYKFVVFDFETKKQIQLPISESESSFLSWRSESEVYIGGPRGLKILNLDDLIITGPKKISQKEFKDIFSKNAKLNYKHLYMDQPPKPRSSNIAISDSDGSFGRVLIKNVRSAIFDSTSDLKKIGFVNSKNGGLYIAHLGLRNAPQMVFEINFDKQKKLTSQQRSEFKKYFKAHADVMENGLKVTKKYTIWATVYSPKINPLNNKVIGPDEKKIKGYVRFLESDELKSTVGVDYEYEIIRKGDVIANIKSNTINGRSFCSWCNPKTAIWASPRLWAVLK